MFNAFRGHIESNFPELNENPLILACSGGLDSTVLAHMVSKLTSNFTLAHVNFKLRGKESDADQAFVAHLAEQLGGAFKYTQVDTLDYATQLGISTQMAARNLRYNWFQELIDAGTGTLLLTGHHADDVLETFFINLNRTSGIDGLSGIPAKKGYVRRPMLIYSRSELEAYARQNNLSWREDSSNAEDYYLRNQIRHQLVPVLKSVFPEITSKLLKTQGYFRDSRQLIDSYISSLKTPLVLNEGDVQYFNCSYLQKLDPLKPHLYELFRPYGFTDWEAITALLEGETGKEVHSLTHRLLRHKDSLLLKPKEAKVLPDSYKFSLIDTKHLPINLIVSEVVSIDEIAPEILYVDKQRLKEPLILRKWKKGDYFYPFGMQGRKLISKYFKDIGLSQFHKESQWILCSEEEIVWILGKRADNRFKITPKTQSILKIVWEK